MKFSQNAEPPTFTSRAISGRIPMRCASSLSDLLLDNDGDQLELNFADLDLKTVHAGHLFDAVVSLKEVSVYEKRQVR